MVTELSQNTEAAEVTFDWLTPDERRHLRGLGPPAFWCETGLKVLGRLVRDGRKRLIHPIRQVPFNVPELSDYIFAATEARGNAYRLSPGAISTLEVKQAHPLHNTIAAIAAAQFIRHPLTDALLNEAEISLVAAGFYDPYQQTIPSQGGIGLFGATNNTPKGGISMAEILKDGGSATMDTVKAGVVQLAAVLKMARITLGCSTAKLAVAVTASTGIEVSAAALQSIESGEGTIPPDVLMALIAHEYATDGVTKRPYTMQEIFHILSGKLQPLNPRTESPFTAADLEFLEIDPAR